MPLILIRRKRTNITTKFFSQTELDIIDLLMKNHNAMLQSAIVASSGISKASASRAIASLENKGVVSKRRKGVTNEYVDYIINKDPMAKIVFEMLSKF